MKKEHYLIQDVFADSKFYLFKKYSLEHNLIYLQDISPEVLEDFAKIAGVGAVKMAALVERLAGPVALLQLGIFLPEELFKKEEI
ncbi:hypothetical protein ACWOFR_11505 [Carnobacterium gallinarum]|uniref:hypothetical protein n=1 Tax=Carnobacterium gallinarum TaxID=2749 RepID=UPI00068B9FC4|nr:hypothetical protein [Carnobacterium gallinarum]